jgi:PQQ-dependent catabolism-associated CXXCW motif protein
MVFMMARAGRQFQRRAVLTGLLVSMIGWALAGEPSPFDPVTGYRISRYRAPVPDTVPGGTTINLESLDTLVAAEQAVLLDVLASEGAGPDPITGEWRLSKEHRNIPGSVWLSDVGKGELTVVIDTYYRENLARLTRGNPAAPVIIYCQADCWQSWNAVKRAASYGYTRLYWYPEGIDGWSEWDDRPLDTSRPVPLKSSPP